SIMQGEDVEAPILQLITIRAIATGNGLPRYRMLMSDGVNILSSFMLATQQNSLVDEGHLVAHAICKINRFIVNILKDGRKVIILMDLDVVKTADVVGGKIGNPVLYAEEELKAPLEEYVNKRYPGLVKVVRNQKREGLIRARIEGWKVASGQITGFFDAHVEFTAGW
ncbi:UNVERIFIED_CONTAM: 60S acidic ribosomal protein P1, partial [Gekko kuhli]